MSRAAFDVSGKDIFELIDSYPYPLRDHCRRVAVCASIIAEYAHDNWNLYGKLPPGVTLSAVAHLSGACHDVGKLPSPGPLLGEEDYRAHPAMGESLLRENRRDLFDNETLALIVMDVTRHHHERPDSRGFPDGLPRKDISLLAGVCAMANELDHLFGQPGEDRELDRGIKRYILDLEGVFFTEIAVSCFDRAWPRLRKQYAKWGFANDSP